MPITPTTIVGRAALRAGSGTGSLANPPLPAWEEGRAAVTHLIGEVRVAAHARGVVTCLTSVNVELISVAQLSRTTNHEWKTNS